MQYLVTFFLFKLIWTFKRSPERSRSHSCITHTACYRVLMTGIEPRPQWWKSKALAAKPARQLLWSMNLIQTILANIFMSKVFTYHDNENRVNIEVPSIPAAGVVFTPEFYETSSNSQNFWAEGLCLRRLHLGFFYFEKQTSWKTSRYDKHAAQSVLKTCALPVWRQADYQTPVYKSTSPLPLVLPPPSPSQAPVSLGTSLACPCYVSHCPALSWRLVTEPRVRTESGSCWF